MIAAKRISSISIYLVQLILITQLFVSCAAAANNVKWQVSFVPGNITIHMDETKTINLTISGLDKVELQASNATISVISNATILQVAKTIPLDEIKGDSWSGSVDINGVFIGNAKVFVRIDKKGSSEYSDTSLPVVIIRAERFIDKLFVICVASLVSILYINFGAALDLQKVKGVLLRPIGPGIAFFCHFVFLPLSSYALGLLLFPEKENVPLQLGLFFTGASPAGGASNIWTVILGGNLDLSITMSTTSTLSAFGMMPLWIFTLGQTIFKEGNLEIPYGQIASYTYGLIIPIIIGLLIQRYCPRVARFLVRILKSCSALLIVFIVVFAIVTNLYLFKLFTWEIFIAGLALPWLGYFVGWLLAVCFRQEYEDRLAIAVEAGIQNTGIAIFILRFALGQPQADLTTVMPVAVAIMTPFPLMAYYLCYKGREWVRRRRTQGLPAESKHCIQSVENAVY